MKIFVSYKRNDQELVEKLIEELKIHDHEIWYDQEVIGGQEWWSEILQNIRNCQVFIMILTQKYLESEACQQEYKYAIGLNRHIIPISVDTNLDIMKLPEPLKKFQIIKNFSLNLTMRRALVNALKNAKPAPLPEPLPEVPRMPLSPSDQQVNPRKNLPKAKFTKAEYILNTGKYPHSWISGGYDMIKPLYQFKNVQIWCTEGVNRGPCLLMFYGYMQIDDNKQQRKFEQIAKSYLGKPFFLNRYIVEVFEYLHHRSDVRSTVLVITSDDDLCNREYCQEMVNIFIE